MTHEYNSHLFIYSVHSVVLYLSIKIDYSIINVWLQFLEFIQKQKLWVKEWWF